MAVAPGSQPDEPLHAYLRKHARQTPHKPACIWYGRELTYGELDRASDALAARLQELGVKQGDPVVLYLQNCPQYVISHFAIQKIGAIVCPCSPLNKMHELEYLLNDLGAQVIVAAENLLSIIEGVWRKTQLRHALVTTYAELLPSEPAYDVPGELTLNEPRPDTSIPTEDLMAATRQERTPTPVAIELDDVALITYTSGSTGMPKGAMLTYGNALRKSAATVQASGIAGDDVVLAVAPMYHIAGMIMGINVPIFIGATTVLMYRFEAVATLQAVARYRVSWWYSMAPMNVAAIQAMKAHPYDLSSLRTNLVTSFGVTFDERLANEWKTITPQCVSCEAAYGLSETHTIDTCMPRGDIRWGTHGKAVEGNEIRIVDPDTGRECEPEESGEITIRGIGNFAGYWNKPEATASALRGGWLHTGDVGRMDRDGYLTFMGRFKEMIKVSGYSVFPEEVESILVKHPAILQAAATALSHPEKGEVVKAHIVLKPNASLSEQELVDWAKENMAAYKVPREIEFLNALPTTGAGKVLRRMLKNAH